MKANYIAGAVLAVSLAAPVCAQGFGLPGLGGSKSASTSADPAKVEQDLKTIIETTSFALSRLADALGLKEEGAKLASNAECIKAGSCGLSDSVDVVQTVGQSVVTEANKRKSSGEKLEAAAAAKAAEALLPAVIAFPLWKKVADGAKDIDKSSAMRFAGLMKAVPKVPAAAKGTVDVMNAGIAYLSFSGANTKALEEQAKSNLKI